MQASAMIEFEMIDDIESRQRTRVPRQTFYLLFRHNGYDKVGKVTTLEEATARARDAAKANPGKEYVVMKAEILITTRPDKVNEIPLFPSTLGEKT